MAIDTAANAFSIVSVTALKLCKKDDIPDGTMGPLNTTGGLHFHEVENGQCLKLKAAVTIATASFKRASAGKRSRTLLEVRHLPGWPFLLGW